MRGVRQTLLTALRDLKELDAKFALVGGLAVSARADARMTRDVDFAVGVDNDAAAEQIIYRLQLKDYQVFSVLEHTVTHRLATVRLVPPGASVEGAVLDLLFASSGIEPEVAAAAEHATFLRRIQGPLALAGHLIAMKILSNSEKRPQDAADLRALLSKAQEDDLDIARQALQLIVARGYGREKPLLDLLEKARALAAPNSG